MRQLLFRDFLRPTHPKFEKKLVRFIKSYIREVNIQPTYRFKSLASLYMAHSVATTVVFDVSMITSRSTTRICLSDSVSPQIPSIQDSTAHIRHEAASKQTRIYRFLTNLLAK